MKCKISFTVNCIDTAVLISSCTHYHWSRNFESSEESQKPDRHQTTCPEIYLLYKSFINSLAFQLKELDLKILFSFLNNKKNASKCLHYYESRSFKLLEAIRNGLAFMARRPSDSAYYCAIASQWSPPRKRFAIRMQSECVHCRRRFGHRPAGLSQARRAKVYCEFSGKFALEISERFTRTLCSCAHCAAQLF